MNVVPSARLRPTHLMLALIPLDRIYVMNWNWDKTTIEKIFRLFLLIILPFLLGFWLIPHQHIINGESLSSPSEPQSNFSHTLLQYSYGQNLSESAHFQQMGAIFPFAQYLNFYPLVQNLDPKVCFEDKGSTITYPNGIEVPVNFNWKINFNNAKNISLSTRSEIGRAHV